MSCACDCVSCTEFCDCQRCLKSETALLNPPSNRPGLDTIKARIGDYSAFFSDARRRLSSSESPHLQALGTRAATDPTIALLDAWSVTADVLTFYRERLTQETYLRTATDERSLHELANMVGFRPRPGIAATVQLAYTLDPSAKPVDIHPGAKVQTVPLPGEKMQTFETDEELSARAEWSQMKPRQTRPMSIDILDALTRPVIRITDTSLVVRPGERVLFVFGLKSGQQVAREVLSSKTSFESGYVELILKSKDGLVQALVEDPGLVMQLLDIRESVMNVIDNADPVDDQGKGIIKIGKLVLAVISSWLLGSDVTEAAKIFSLDTQWGDFAAVFNGVIEDLNKIFTMIATTTMPARQSLQATRVDDILKDLQLKSRVNLTSTTRVLQQANKGLDSAGAVRIELAHSLIPVFEDSLHLALGVMAAKPVSDSQPAVYLLRSVASAFGAVAPRKMLNQNGRFANKEWPIDDADIAPGAAYLDTVVDSITADSFILVDTPLWSLWQEGNDANEEEIDSISVAHLLRFARVRAARTLQRGSYGISGKVTRLELADAASGDSFPIITQAT